MTLAAYPRFTLFFTLFSIIAVTSALQADNFRWTGTNGDGLWATAGNWEIEDADNPGVWDPAVTAPGSGASVYFGNAAANAAQSVALTGNVEVARVIMEGEGDRAYSLTGSDHTLSLTATPLITRSESSTANLTIDVPVEYITNSSFSLSNQSTSGRMVIGQQLEFNAPLSTSTTSLGIAGSGLIDFQGNVLFTTGAGNSRINVSTGANVLFSYDGPGSFLNRPLVFTGGSLENPVNLYFANSMTLANRIWFLTSAQGVANMQLMESGVNDVVVSTADLIGFSSSGPESPNVLNLLAPTDGSSGSLTLALTSDISTAGSTARSVQINLAENTFIQLGRDQTLPNAVDVSGGIHGEGGLIKSGGDGVSEIGDKNTYTGGTFIESNIVLLISGDVRLTRSEIETEPYAGTIGPGLLHIASAGTFHLNNLNQTVAGLRDSPTAFTGGTVNLGSTAAGTLTINAVEDSEFDGTITGQGSVVKTGAGNQTSTGGVDFTGTFDVLGGTFTANGTVADTVVLSVGADGTLAGTGVVAAATQVGGTLAAGNSPGTLTFTNDLGFEANSNVAFDLGNLGNDLIVLSGSNQILSSDGPLLWLFSAQGEVLTDSPYLLIDWTAATALDQSGFTIGDSLIANSGWAGDFSSDADGLYVTFTAIPEPRLYALAFGAVVCGLVILRRRCKHAC